MIEKWTLYIAEKYIKSGRIDKKKHHIKTVYCRYCSWSNYSDCSYLDNEWSSDGIYRRYT